MSRRIVRRRTLPRSRTISVTKPLTLEENLETTARLIHRIPDRPRIRMDCINGPRPCPWVGCKWHLYLDINFKGSIKLNWPHLDVDEIPATCALDIADRGGLTLEEVGWFMNLTRERIRQLEKDALDNVRDVIDGWI